MRAFDGVLLEETRVHRDATTTGSLMTSNAHLTNRLTMPSGFVAADGTAYLNSNLLVGRSNVGINTPAPGTMLDVSNVTADAAEQIGPQMMDPQLDC